MSTIEGMQVGRACSLVIALSCGCESATLPPTPEDSIAAEPVRLMPSIGLIGCDALFAEPTCLRLSPRSSSIWLAGVWSAEEFELRLDGLPIPGVEWSRDERGLLIHLPEIPPVATLAIVHRDGSEIRVRFDRMPSEYEAILGLARAGELGAARGRWSTARGRTGGRPGLLLDCLRAKLDYVDEDWLAVREAPERLAAHASMLGDQACLPVLHLSAAKVALGEQVDFNAAADHIQAARGYAGARPDIAVQADSLDATLAQRIGRVEQSLTLLERAELQARSLRLPDLIAALALTRAKTLADIGRFDEAEGLGVEAIASLRGTSERLGVRNNLAWIRVLHREDDPRAKDPVAELRELVAEDPRPTTWLNLAIACSRVGGLDEAAQALARLDDAKLGDRDRVWFELASARVELGLEPVEADRSRARPHLDRASEFAERGREPEARLRVHLERASLEFGAGELQAARAEFEAAEQIADRIALAIDGSAGRSLFSTSRSHSRGLHVELLLSLDDRDAALCTVLGSRARHLRALAAGTESLASRDPSTARRYRELLSEYQRRKTALVERERAAWQLSKVERDRAQPELIGEAEALELLLRAARRLVEQDPPAWRCDQARPVAAGHALLTMIGDSAGSGWHFLLDQGGEVEVVHLSVNAGETTEALAVRALAALADRLATVDTLKVVATGEFAAIDFQSLVPDHQRVVQGLGLGAPSESPVWRGSATVRAESGGLVHVQREVEAVREALSGAGWQLEAWSPSDPTPPDFLHFCGHGERGGPAGWSSALLLGRDERLTSTELIVNQRSPKLVLLSACVAGMTSPEAIDGGMNMAVAFLLAGAEMVIAPDRDVEDEVAADLAAFLYREVPIGASGPALREHLMERLAAAKAVDSRFRGWRVWVR